MEKCGLGQCRHFDAEEASNLPHVFDRLPEGLAEVIVVDGHSMDDTIEVARRLRPDVLIVHQEGKGKGDALACGFAACSGDVIVMIDADGSTDPAEIPRFVEAVVNGADFVKGSRMLEGGGSDDLTAIRSMGNRALSLIVNTLYGTKYSDLCYGYNMFRRACLEHLIVDCPGFEVETLINIRVAKLGMRVAEVPSHEGRRIHGTSNLHPVRDGFRILNVILRERFVRPGSSTEVSGGASRRAPVQRDFVTFSIDLAYNPPGRYERQHARADLLPVSIDLAYNGD